MLVCGRPLRFGDWEQIEALRRMEFEVQPKKLWRVTVAYEQPVTKCIVVSAVNEEEAEAAVALCLPEGCWFEVQQCEDTGELATEGDNHTLALFAGQPRAQDATTIRGVDSPPADVRLG